MTVVTDDLKYETQFFKDLLKCPIDRVQKLLHHLVDIYCGQKNSYETYSDIYAITEWWDLLSSSYKFWKLTHVEESLNSLKFELLPEEYQDILKDVIEIRTLDLKASSLERSHAVSLSYLNSFDWKLKLTLASDKMSQMNEPRLMLDLDVTGEELLKLDLNKEELKSLINTMEKAKKAVLDMME